MVFWGIHLFQISVECLDIFEVLLTHSIASVLLCNTITRSFIGRAMYTDTGIFLLVNQVKTFINKLPLKL